MRIANQTIFAAMAATALLAAPVIMSAVDLAHAQGNSGGSQGAASGIGGHGVAGNAGGNPGGQSGASQGLAGQLGGGQGVAETAKSGERGVSEEAEDFRDDRLINGSNQ
jgi:hypothetical protein